MELSELRVLILDDEPAALAASAEKAKSGAKRS